MPPKSPLSPNKQVDQRNLLMAVILSTVLVVTWQVLVESPKRKEMAKWHAIEQQKKELQLKQAEEEKKVLEAETNVSKPLTRAEILAQSPRVTITSPKLQGTIALKGLRLDDLELAQYKVSQAHDSKPVSLLEPLGTQDSYFAQIGWLSSSGNVPVPDAQTLWQADRGTLSPDSPVTFRWDNGQGQTFLVTASLDKDYMFTLKQRVENRGASAVTLAPYAYLNRAYADNGKYNAIMHEGPIAVLGNGLEEMRYKKIHEMTSKRYTDANGWLGITDKYWLTALIPGSKDFKAAFSYYQSKGQDRYQAEYSGQSANVAAGGHAETTLRLFAGAKEIGALDNYAEGDAEHGVPPVPLFDRAVDFGSLYFLTKPMFLLLTYFYAHVGNFGIAIMLLTIVVKLLMFPLANKGFHATTQMRALQPEMTKLRETYGKDRVRMQQELAALYKREKVNPAAGCLPVVVQLPVFFALYKVFYVTIEMRQAPFFGWIHDLSVADPSNIFTLFGLFPWPTPPTFEIGLLPILMGITMIIQTSMQPKPNDPTQARVMQFMPYMLVFVLAKMPAGLVLYWTWSNILSIVQQWVITKRYNAAHPDHQAK